VSWVRQFSLTIAASVTLASWVYGSPSPLARVPPKLDLMPVMQGYPHDFGEVRTRWPYQTWHASRALRHGLAPRPRTVIAVSPCRGPPQGRARQPRRVNARWSSLGYLFSEGEWAILGAMIHIPSLVDNVKRFATIRLLAPTHHDTSSLQTGGNSP
jgi:hypothetical protein